MYVESSCRTLLVCLTDICFPKIPWAAGHLKLCWEPGRKCLDAEEMMRRLHPDIEVLSLDLSSLLEPENLVLENYVGSDWWSPNHHHHHHHVSIPSLDRLQWPSHLLWP